ncbi:MAG: Hsp20 family protein [Planctomycetales bacterium]|nr:Hsp20 family protein [Planctomycetales bacterium]NIM08817.1 Hsp20 family protein [Planctomycetales bacterium]NIN08276.1 Hsp20 family protein [Planctomycetales bacterium]NIN77405.1 Hsp20 family protein [Planctomycetales bacterium]NIO34582.1 Hsp20 family protein [Planctomycetales bacterium]
MSGRPLDPFRELEAILRGTGRPAAQRPAASQETMTAVDWEPIVDIAETADEYLIHVELPEVGKDAVKVSAREGVLTIAGERKLERPEGLTYHRVERGHGSFARSFTLPEDVETENIRAEQRNGMLYLHLPKHKAPPPKSIKIEVQ